MSELGTVSRKSLVSRFDKDHIVKVATDPDNTDRVWITYISENGNEESVAVSLSSGFPDYPKMTATITNNSSNTVTMLFAYDAAAYGIKSTNPTVSSGSTETVESIFILLSSGFYGWSWGYTGTAALDKIVDMVNCKRGENLGSLIVIDPTKDASCTIILKNV